MKNMKKLVGIAMLTIALIVSMVIPSFAANITINNQGAEGSEYAAYKLLNADDLGDNKFAYSLNETYADILKSVTKKTEQDDIIGYINDLDTDGIRIFADAVYTAILAADPAITADATCDDGVFENAAQGYYLIAEIKAGDAADTLSLVMLDTAGKENITVTTKEGIPTVEKKVEEKNDTTAISSWGESADYDIGDSINYTLTGTVSDKYASYKSYYYEFIDEMSAGLTYNDNSAKVYVVNGEEKTDVTEQFSIAFADQVLTAKANLKELTGVTVNASSKILVEYSATLNENAVSGTAGNPNEVYIQYENDPYHNADGDPATPDKPGDDTPENPDDDTPGVSEKDIAIVFTFDVIVNKVDKDNNELNGAGFTLYKDIEGTWTTVGAQITGVTTFIFEGLDAGEYKLVETTVPTGYNKADDIEFEVVAAYDTDKEPVELTGLQVKNAEGTVISGEGLTFNVDLTKGEVSTNVVNVAGTELPSTGGIGTTIFYIAGGILVVAAIVLLVAKKRMSAEG